MPNFNKQIRDHQVQWRLRNLDSQRSGKQNGKEYPWILPKELWEEGLWHGIRSSENSLPVYVKKNKVQKHYGVHNLTSSWMLCANLYFPFRASEQGHTLFAGFLRAHVDSRIHQVGQVELEFAEKTEELSPSTLLGERGGARGAGQTSPDLAFVVNDGKGLILTENKFVEHSFYSCSARRRTGSNKRPGNPDPDRCKNASAVLKNPETQCHQVVWKRKYWECLSSIINREALSSLKCCPAAYAGYQLFRQQALAEGIAQSGKYDFVISCVAVDERNTVLANCLKGTGIKNLVDWSKLFNGKVKFAVFTHQSWISWVRDHDSSGRWRDWLTYIENRYGGVR